MQNMSERRYLGNCHIHTNPVIQISFDVLLPVHLSIFISVINQLDAQNWLITEINTNIFVTCYNAHPKQQPPPHPKKL